MKSIFALLFVVSSAWGYTQPTLLPSIGISSEPQNNDPICWHQCYTGNFELVGPSVGDTIPHFKLYDVNGDSMDIAELLGQGLPVLLVGGNLTCPVFRNMIPVINDVMLQYAAEIEVAIIYGLEAHPDPDTSIYFCAPNPGNANISQGVLFPQPTTYLERKNLVDTLNSYIGVDPPIYLDGPCNAWLDYFGPAPNNAYLIDTNGVIFAKHGWFHKQPAHNIYDDIDSLLYGSTSGGGSTNGSFELVVTDSNAYGNPGQTLYAYAQLENNSSEDVIIDMIREVESLPVGWTTSMCVDVCYPETTDSATLLLAAGTSKLYTMYFYTDATPGSGSAKIKFRNQANSSNTYTQWFWGYTDGTTSVEPFDSGSNIKVYPNPASVNLTVAMGDNELRDHERYDMQIIQSEGKLIMHTQLNPFSTQVNVRDLAPGIYTYTINHGQTRLKVGTLIIE